MFNRQIRIITMSLLSTFALTCSSTSSGERALSNRTAPVTPSVVTPAEQPQRETQGAPAKGSRSPFPAPPLIVRYEYAPRYFVQWLNDHPQYTRIEAAGEDGEPAAFTLILTEKDSGRRVNYCDSKERAQALAQAGQEARPTKISYRATNNFDQAPSHEFSFTDERGQAVRWRFPLAAPVSERGAGLTPQEGGAGLRLIYREMGTAAGEGASVQIGDKVCEAEPWTEISAPPYFVAYRGAYSEGVGVGALLPGLESWRVTESPEDWLKEGAQWTFADDRGRIRRLRLAAKRGDELTIQETGGSMALQARQTPAGFALRSITLSSRSKAMRVSFTPELDLAANSATPVDFQIDQNGHNKIAHGSLSVEKRGAAARLRWTFKSPDWAKSRTIDTTVTIDIDGYKVETR
jgi:hypothetical protein